MTQIRYLTTEDFSIYKSLLLQGINKELEVLAWKLQNEKCLNDTDLHKLLSTDSTDCIVLGAFEQDILMGAVTLIHHQTYSFSHKATLENMCVKDENQASKDQISNLLMRQIFKICNEKEIEILMTSLISNNISGKVFFSNLNFETLVLEHHARKYDNYYVDEHWLIYHFDGNDSDLFV
ncbi:GNAT family N-acetyltransferase [Staphylococcus xylosus]|uniref:GNAT family N-acetyltransferase n=1 Tax=Staphylococcus xylosus TaxID=1288 RepID=A0AAQ0LZN6_STAXY|nr:GNAT family N-acetyltransferase [Staphylococcus xylosus]RIM63594.1 GNAT family N-acetyltransferase [Staphylococcus xylosus]RIM93106.1 GNAT family N-acetyltransferase [Staphylococcus xylosus]